MRPQIGAAAILGVRMDNGWDQSANAWIESQGSHGDHARHYVLDDQVMARLRASGARTLLDVGCGEGRFCRMAAQAGVTTIGIDPTEGLIARAQELDPNGTYHIATAEALPLADGSVDCVVFYLTLIDIPDLAAAIAEAHRVLRDGGRVIVANLAGFITAARHDGWSRKGNDTGVVELTGYLDEDVYWTHWAGIRIQNHHRPPKSYFQGFLNAGFALTHYDEPRSTHPDPEERARYDNVAYLTLMEWQKT